VSYCFDGNDDILRRLNKCGGLKVRKLAIHIALAGPTAPGSAFVRTVLFFPRATIRSASSGSGL
jgi:hypothetical protein